MTVIGLYRARKRRAGYLRVPPASALIVSPANIGQKLAQFEQAAGLVRAFTKEPEELGEDETAVGESGCGVLADLAIQEPAFCVSLDFSE